MLSGVKRFVFSVCVLLGKLVELLISSSACVLDVYTRDICILRTLQKHINSNEAIKAMPAAL